MHDEFRKLLIVLGVGCFAGLPLACDLDDKGIGESAGDDETGDDDNSGDADGECTPPDPTVSFTYQAPDFGFGDVGNVDIDSNCEVLSVDASDGLQLELDCPDTQQPVAIEVTANPSFSLAVPIAIGDPIRVRYIRHPNAFSNHYLLLDSGTGDRLITLVDAEQLFPPEGYFGFSLPAGISFEHGLCSGGSNACGPLERVRLGFDVDGAAPQLFDGSYFEVVPYPTFNLWLVEARELVGEPCLDIATGWYRVLFVSGV